MKLRIQLIAATCGVTFFLCPADPVIGQYERWVNRYDSPDHSSDRPVGLAADHAGGATIAVRSGTDFIAIKYDTSGQQEWLTQFDGGYVDSTYGMAIDNLGNVLLCGIGYNASNRDFLVVKLNPLGQVQWSARYDNMFEESSAYVAVDSDGNVVVTGSSQGHNTLDDYATVKFSPTGSQLWSARYAGPSSGIAGDSPSDVKIDSHGNVIVTGYSETANQMNARDYATVKYNASGTQQWVARYNGPSNTSDTVAKSAVDDQGNIYVTGTSAGEWATIKYDTDGSQAWTSRYRGPTPGTGSGNASDLQVDEAGNVYVAGQWTLTASSDLVIIKYDSHGSQLWAMTYNGPANSSDGASAFTLDGAGNIYVAGYASIPQRNVDFVTIKYDLGGQELWHITYGGSASQTYDAAQFITLTPAGDVLVAGDSNTGSTDAVTIKYSQDQFPDCNENGRPDVEDVQLGISADCNANYVPDECEKVTCAGACCLSDGSCMVVREALCRLFPGSNWAGPDTSCVNIDGVVRCPLGACCLPDGSCTGDVAATNCAARGGLFRGFTSQCANANCPQPQGACCLANGSCLNVGRADCDVFPGATWAGPLTTCVNVSGSLRCPVGACCLADGSCREALLPVDCQDLGGMHQPGGVTCIQAACPQPSGACCLSNGGCVAATEAECALFAGATWAGALSACADVGGTPTCPLGACCLPSGDCLGGVLQAACTAQGGTFRGPGSGCASANCPQPTGACCLANGSCIVLLRADCQAAPNNRWAGANTTCVDGNANGRADACESVPGDINGDGAANPADIPPFVAVMLGTPQAPEHVGRADVNGDGAANGADVGRFAQVLTGG